MTVPAVLCVPVSAAVHRSVNDLISAVVTGDLVQPHHTPDGMQISDHVVVTSLEGLSTKDVHTPNACSGVCGSACC